MDDLLKRALDQWERAVFPFENGQATLLSVFDAFDVPGRYYHTLQHIAEMTVLLAEQRNSVQNLTDLVLASLWHDIVYDARRSDNEEKSVELWRRDAARMQVPSPTIEHVSDLILATRTHQPAPDTQDMRTFLDADLAILGAGVLRYERYMHGVRYEYAHVPEADYRSGRTRVLQKFLDRPQLYFTGAMRDRFEERARHNLALEIAALARPDTFFGQFSEDASHRLTFSIASARAEFYEAFEQHARSQFNFHAFSDKTWGPDQLIGTCNNGKIQIGWGHDSASGFYFYAEEKIGEALVKDMGNYFNSIIAQPELNIYRTYLLFET